ncbi:MAG: plastocyanin/azurin family copper-binding protein [Dehalococcoidia bacterium]
MRNRLFLGLTAAFALAAFAVACGSDDDSDTTSSEGSAAATSVATTGASSAASDPYGAASPAAAATTAPQPAAPQAITVNAGDYFYAPTDFQVRPGTVVVTMTNEGPERPHTFTIKNQTGDGDLFKSDRVPVGGEPVTLEFAVTEEGTYELYCNLPGHADRGQRGTLTVSRT